MSSTCFGRQTLPSLGVLLPVYTVFLPWNDISISLWQCWDGVPSYIFGIAILLFRSRTQSYFLPKGLTEDNLIHFSLDGPLPCRILYRAAEVYRWDWLPLVPDRQVTHFKVAYNMNICIFSQLCIWSFLPFEMWRYVPGYCVIKCRDRLLVLKRRRKITQWHSVISQKNGVFLYLFTKCEVRCWFLGQFNINKTMWNIVIVNRIPNNFCNLGR